MLKFALPVLILFGSLPAAGQDASVPANKLTGDTKSVRVDSAPITKDRRVGPEYQIGGGDVLEISVWHEPEASVRGVVVRTDGKISLPLIKDVSVIGMTPSQAEAMIAERMGKFIHDPDVTVVVVSANSQRVYVTGSVKKEGPLPYAYNMTVMQALSEAGGLTDFAKKKKIYVLRTQSGHTEMFKFDYDAVLKGKKMELNIPLMPGDNLVVPH